MSYLPLCSITLRHPYFSDGLLQQAHLQPAAETVRQLHNAQLLFKATKQGGLLLLDSSRREVAAACCDPLLTLYFLLYSQDAQFGSYSLPLLAPQQVLYCDNRTPTPDDAGFRLHPSAELTAAERVSVSDTRLASLSQLTRQPLLVLALDITRAQIEQLGPDTATPYVLRFGCRRSIWRYYLCGSAFAQPVQIQDMAQHSRFVPQGATRLANGRLAQVFDSTEPLMLQQFSPYRFQLVSTAHGSGKILIKRLPVATAGQFDKAVVNGVESNVSEIYLNY